MGYFTEKYGGAEQTTQSGGYFAKKYIGTPFAVESTQTAKPFIVNKKHKGVTGWLSKTGAAIGNFVSSRTPLGSKPVQEQARTTVETVSSTFEDTKRRFNLAHDAFSRNAPPLEKSGAVADAALGLVKLMFAPISGEMKGAEQLPGIKRIAKPVNWTFEKAAEYAGKYMDQVKKLTPDSPEKERVWKTLGPVGKEITGLAAQLALAKVGELAIKAPENYIKETNKAIDYLNRVRTTAAIEEGGYIARKYGAKPKTTITPPVLVAEPVVKATPESPLLTEARKYKSAEEFGDSVVNISKDVKVDSLRKPKVVTIFDGDKAVGRIHLSEDIVNGKKFAHIDGVEIQKAFQGQGKGTQLFRDTIKALELSEYDGILARYETITNKREIPTIFKKLGFTDIGDGKGLGLELKTKSQLTDIWKQAQKTPTETVGGTPSKIATSIEQKAIEAKLTTGFKDIAGYEKINVAEQARMATDIINKDVELARKIIRGEEPLPSNLNSISLVKAFEEFALKNKDANLAYELANSPHLTGSSVAAQTLRMAAERSPDSATAKIIEIKRAREAKVKDLPKRKVTESKSLKKEIEKNNLTKEELSFNKFLDAITC